MMCDFWWSLFYDVTHGSATGDTTPDHLRRVDDLVEARSIDIAGFERRFPEAQILVVRLVCNRRCLVVADDRAQCGHQHQRAAEHFIDPLTVEAGPLDRETPELFAGIAQHAGGMQEIVDDDWAHGVEFEITLAAREGDGIVLADHLDA